MPCGKQRLNDWRLCRELKDDASAITQRIRESSGQSFNLVICMLQLIRNETEKNRLVFAAAFLNPLLDATRRKDFQFIKRRQSQSEAHKDWICSIGNSARWMM